MGWEVFRHWRVDSEARRLSIGLQARILIPEPSSGEAYSYAMHMIQETSALVEATDVGWSNADPFVEWQGGFGWKAPSMSYPKWTSSTVNLDEPPIALWSNVTLSIDVVPVIELLRFVNGPYDPYNGKLKVGPPVYWRRKRLAVDCRPGKGYTFTAEGGWSTGGGGGWTKDYNETKTNRDVFGFGDDGASLVYMGDVADLDVGGWMSGATGIIAEATFVDCDIDGFDAPGMPSGITIYGVGDTLKCHADDVLVGGAADVLGCPPTPYAVDLTVQRGCKAAVGFQINDNGTDPVTEFTTGTNGKVVASGEVARTPWRENQYPGDIEAYGPGYAFNMDATDLTAKNFDAEDVRLPVCESEIENLRCIRITQPDPWRFEPFTSISGWAGTGDVSVSLSAGCLKAVVASGTASVQKTNYTTKIRARPFINVRVKGPIGTFQFLLDGHSYDVAITEADTWATHQIDTRVTYAPASVWIGHSLPRHTHQAVPPYAVVDTPYTIQMAGLVVGTYYFDYLDETGSPTGGGGPVTPITPRVSILFPRETDLESSGYLYDFTTGSLEYYHHRALSWSRGAVCAVKQTYMDPAEAQATAIGRLEHLPVAVRVYNTGTSAETYTFPTVADFYDGLDTELSASYHTLQLGNAAYTGTYDYYDGDGVLTKTNHPCYANSTLLAAWMCELVDPGPLPTWAVQVRPRYDTLSTYWGDPVELLGQGTKHIGAGIFGYLCNEATGEGNKGIESAGLVARRDGISWESDTWRTEATGHFVGPREFAPTDGSFQNVEIEVLATGDKTTVPCTTRRLTRVPLGAVEETVSGARAAISTPEGLLMEAVARDSANVVYRRCEDRAGSTWEETTVAAVDSPGLGIWESRDGSLGVCYVESNVGKQKSAACNYISADLPNWRDAVTIFAANVQDITTWHDRNGRVWLYACIQGTEAPYNIVYNCSMDGGATKYHGSDVTVSATDAAVKGIGISMDDSGVIWLIYTRSVGGDQVYKADGDHNYGKTGSWSAV